jgi:hypothetical protein
MQDSDIEIDFTKEAELCETNTSEPETAVPESVGEDEIVMVDYGVGKMVACKVRPVQCFWTDKALVPVNLEDVPPSRTGLEAVLERHLKTYLPKRFKSLKESGKLDDWLTKQVEDYQEALQQGIDQMADMTGETARLTEIEEVLLPQYIYLTPEPGMEFR